MQREEKHQEAAIGAIIAKVNELKAAIGAMLRKVESEQRDAAPDWPAFLDSYALLASHLTGLAKLLSAETAPRLRALALLPLALCCERDEALAALTEGRVPAFAHDLAPDYLRTKPEPAAEARTHHLAGKAAALSADAAQKQACQFAKVAQHVYEIVAKGREEWEGGEATRAAPQQTHSLADTHALAAAVGTGKGLRPLGQPPPGPPSQAGAAPPGPPNQPGVAPTPGARGAPPPPGGGPPPPKPPSSIKTNIKAAAQIHPYQR